MPDAILPPPPVSSDEQRRVPTVPAPPEPPHEDRVYRMLERISLQIANNDAAQQKRFDDLSLRIDLAVEEIRQMNHRQATLDHKYNLLAERVTRLESRVAAVEKITSKEVRDAG